MLRISYIQSLGKYFLKLHFKGKNISKWRTGELKRRKGESMKMANGKGITSQWIVTLLTFLVFTSIIFPMYPKATQEALAISEPDYQSRQQIRTDLVNNLNQNPNPTLPATPEQIQRMRQELQDNTIMDSIAPEESSLTAQTPSISALTGCDNNLPISSVSASGQTSSSNSPQKTIDNLRYSYWKHSFSSAWITANLGTVEKKVCYVTIDWYQVGSNTYKFDVYTSKDGVTFTKIAGPFTDTNISGPEKYDVPDINAKFVKIQMVSGTNVPMMRELDVFGGDSGTLPPPPPPPPPPPAAENLFLIAKMRIHVDDQNMLVNLYKPNMKAGDIALSHPNAENFDQYTKQLPGPGVQYFSLAEITANAAALKARGATIISFDLEPEYSPAVDANNPPAAIKAACEVIHANGMKCMASPSRALTTQYGVQLAPFLDVYNIQAQALQDNGCQTGYQSYVEDMYRKLKAANPNLLVTSQVSTSRGTLDNMKECFAAVADVVDGANNFYSNDQEGFDKLRGFVEWFDDTYRPTS